MSNTVMVPMLDLEAPHGEGVETEPLEITISSLPPARINVVFDRIQARNYHQLADLLKLSINDADGMDDLIAEKADDDQVKDILSQQKAEKDFECVRMKRQLDKLADELGGVPDPDPEDNPSISYLRSVADEVCCDAAVVELATGHRLVDFVAISSFSGWRKICELVKEENADFLSIFSDRIGRK